MLIKFKSLRPMMDELDSGSGGVATSQETSSTDTSTESSTESTASAESQGEGTVSEPGETETKAKQTPEQDRAYADLRRKSEAAEKRANEVEMLRKRDQEVARKYGKDYNVYSDADVEAQWGKSHGITTVAEFEAALQKEAQDQEYKDKGVDPDVINKIIEGHPAVQAAKAQQGQAAINSEMKEFADEYPDLNIKTLKDMQDLPNFEAIKEKAYRGMTLLEAYESVNRAEIRKKNSESAKQAALNSIQSKDHVRGNGSGVEGDTVRIPDDVMEMYRKFNPGKSMDEYKKHYKASNK